MARPRKTAREFYELRVVRRAVGCWAWSGRKDPFGYGQVQLGAGEPRTGAHRVSWVIHNGPIPPGLLVCHHCDNPECTRPDHLFLGTHKDNLQDASRKGRMSVPGKGWMGLRTHCPAGHRFDESNTAMFRGVRLCKKCRAKNQREYVRRKREA